MRQERNLLRVTSQNEGLDVLTANRCLTVVNPRGGTQRGLVILEQVRPVFERTNGQLVVSPLIALARVHFETSIPYCVTILRSTLAGSFGSGTLPVT